VLQAASPHYACRRSCICIRPATDYSFYRSLTYAARRRRVKKQPWIRYGPQRQQEAAYVKAAFAAVAAAAAAAAVASWRCY